MGKFTEALKKAAEKQIERVEKKDEVRPYVVRTVTDSKIDPHIVTYFDSTSPVSEQYRILRTHLQSPDKGSPPHVLAITSAIHGEGKTVTSVNLAITFANEVNKKSVLLVDADMRRGSVARVLGLKPEKGFADILLGNATIEESLLSIGIENLHILPCGYRPPNPAELIGSKKTKEFVYDVKKKYDFVIFDCPPVIAVTDAGVLAPICDGVALVIQAGRTQQGIIRHAQDRLHAVKANILGFVMTNIEYHIPEYIYRYL